MSCCAFGFPLPTGCCSFVAYTPSLEQEHDEQLWGHEVTQALETRLISRDQVFKDLKPLLFGQRQSQSLHVRRRIAQLRANGRLPPRDPRRQNLAGNNFFEAWELLSDFMGHAIRHVYRCIHQQHRTDWPHWRDCRNYRDFDPATNTLIEVAIPVPVGSTSKQVTWILSAAREAGIPKPYAVAEPAAASAYHFQKAFERSRHVQLPMGRLVLILDIGAGSADLQAFLVQGISPLRVQEVFAGATEWCGGTFVNQICRSMMARVIRDPAVVLASLAQHGYHMTMDELLAEIEEVFDKQKRTFSGTEHVVLPIRGLPNMPAFKMSSEKGIDLEPEEVRAIFQPSFTTLNGMMVNALQEITAKIMSLGLNGQRIDELLLVGGGGFSEYVRYWLTGLCQTTGQFICGYPIPVRMPNDPTASSSTSVSFGSLLLLADKAFVSERIIRRGYCFAWDNPVAVLTQPLDPQQPTLIDPHEGDQRAEKVTKFLIRSGETVPLRHVVFERGWRGLFPDEAKDDGWWFEEQLFWSETITQNDIWVHRPGIDLHGMEPLVFNIPRLPTTNFEERTSPDGRLWYHIEYEIRLSLDGFDMEFELIIPRSGKFQDEPEGCGEDAFRSRGRYDCAGVFYLLNRA